jgi:alkanesulfonate monooxygenase SsuD/methylene tetrahydromethanopterin reductase-like flavin-dependent oxidoreductase (luciferase family)
MGGTLEAVEIYRECFQPSPLLDRPHTIVSATVLAAESDERAAWLAAPMRLRRYGMRTGRMLPLCSPDDAMAHPDIDKALRMPSSSILGTPESVVRALEQLAEATSADELMTFTPTHGFEERLWSVETLAREWGLVPGLDLSSCQ